MPIRQVLFKNASFAVSALVLQAIVIEESSAQAAPPWPTTPPARICGDTNLLSGPGTPPPGAITVPAGDNNGINWNQPGATFWFASGVHTLGTDPFGQIIPGPDTTFIGAPGAVLDGQNLNRYAFTQRARGVTIRYLEISNFGPGAGNNDEGVVNHDSGENWTIEFNYIHDNDGAGVFIGTGTVIRSNCLKDNGQYGFSSYHPDGVSDVVFDRNEVFGNNQDDWESRRAGCGCTGGGKFWDTRNAVVTNNWVHHNRGTGLWVDNNNTNFLFENNYVENNDGVGLFYEVSYNFMIRNNTFIRNALVGGKNKATLGDSFPFGAIYISESGGDTRAGSQYSLSEITSNYFADNWDGIVLWENADRFCRPNEPFDTTNGCPFFDQTWGTRYKTQNIKIHDNEFRVDRAAIGCTNSYCARMAVFSNFGTYPANSPYLGTVVEEAITFAQNNVWSSNTYSGPWHFMAHDAGRDIGFATWQAEPYNQDAGSAFGGDHGPPPTPQPPPPPPPSSENVLDANTSTIEGSVGQWSAWYSSTASQSSLEAHSGTHSLRIDISAAFGWGVQLANFPGFAAAPGSKKVTLWAKLGAGADLQPTLTIKWLDAGQTVLQTDTVVLSPLTTTWQKTTALVDAPAGASTVWAYITGAGSAGDYLYVDDVVIGDPANALDADTASFENSMGQWDLWYSSSISISTNAAHGGTHSLLVEVTDPWGWGVQLANWPGFATSPGAKRLSFWAKGGLGNIAAVTLRVKWLDINQEIIQTDLVDLTSLTTSWQRASADVIAPSGTTTAFVEFYGSSGTAGDTLYVDDIIVTDLENALDADTASLEGSIGQWDFWYSARVSQSVQEARSGTHSLLVEVTDPWGWGVQLAGWPGFAMTPGNRRITYWAKRGSGDCANVTLEVKWFDAAEQIIQIDLIPLDLTRTWRRAVADVVAPMGTRDVRLELRGPGNVADQIYFDGIIVTQSGTQ